MRAVAFLILLALIGAVPAARADTIERRGASGRLEGNIIGVDDAGLHVKMEAGAVFIIPWDNVRRVEMDQPDVRLRSFLPMAEDLWRGRSRVQRGDMALAEPLMARLFERLRGQTHETALIVAEGFLRTLLFRGGNEVAIIPALEVARLRRAGILTDRYRNMEPIYDQESFLCHQLAPAWSRSRLLQAVENDLAEYDSQGDEVVEAMVDLYGQAIRQELGFPATTPPAGSTRSQGGLALLRLCVALGSPEKQQREDARREVERLLPEFAGWREAWVRFALGRSLLMESGVGRRQRGMVELLHVPAQFHRTLPYLSGLALAAVAEAGREQNDAELAALMEAELARLYPHHPAHRATASADQAKDSS